LSAPEAGTTLVVTVQGDAYFEYRYAGHVENGKASIGDPGMGGLI
jgi:phospholipase C